VIEKSIKHSYQAESSGLNFTFFKIKLFLKFEIMYILNERNIEDTWLLGPILRNLKKKIKKCL